MTPYFSFPRLRSWLPLFPAILSGFLLTAAFPDTTAWPLAFVALVPLLISLESMGRKQAFTAGLAAGLAHFLSLIYWLVPTLTTYGNMPLVLALATLLLLALYLALYPALFALGLKYWDPGPRSYALVTALLWTGLEYIRTHALTGFGWGSLGYTLAPAPAWRQAADLGGVLGLSFVLALCNGGITRLIRWRPEYPKMDTLLGLALPLTLAGATYVYGVQTQTLMDKEIQGAPRLRIALAQGNIQQDQKWNQAFRQTTLEKYRRLSMETAARSPALTIWPETALPFYYGRDALPSLETDAIARAVNTFILTGSPAIKVGKERIQYYNRAYMISPKGLVTGSYAKTHLVPFGEYVPLQELIPFIGKITQEAGNYSPGPRNYTPLAFGSHRTGVLICFEILFPGISRAFVTQGAQILTTMTNDAWFGTTSAPAQHYAVAVMRAVENRRSLARAANTGISGFIDPLGRSSRTTPLFQDAAVVADLPLLSRISPYTRFGDLLPRACLIAIFLCFMVKGIQTILRRNQS
ncbi:MAG: apolipoprotein N-acyltransferase [Desulfobacterales bacterium]|nr:apolipoprotein N-acyltransferase [Desulfobacterales bacterium]